MALMLILPGCGNTATEEKTEAEQGGTEASQQTTEKASEEEKTEDLRYDLSGRRAPSDEKGVIISRGRKMLRQ